MIKLYSAPWCPGCKTVAQYLTDNNIEYKYCNIDNELYADELQDLGLRSIPVLLKPDGSWRCTSNIKEIKKFLGVVNDGET